MHPLDPGQSKGPALTAILRQTKEGGIDRRRFLGLSLAGSAFAGACIASARFCHDIERERRRVASASTTFESRFGNLEYAVAGAGPPCIMIHGTGGGFDQGLAFAARLIAAGRTVIAPSRFGYLRSAFPADPSSENQADAIADLLDELGIAQAPVIGGSAGALSAIQFAIRHPGRCSALAAIVPAAFAPGRPAPRPNRIGAAIMEHALKSDFLYWLGLHVAEDALIASLLATDPRLVHTASADEQQRVRSILRSILPVSERARGLLNDAALAGNPAPMALEQITAPTIAISVEDDRFETAAAARHIARSVSGAKLVIYPTGGHVWVGRDQALFDELNGFLPR